jgi:hypothetical protein
MALTLRIDNDSACAADARCGVSEATMQRRVTLLSLVEIGGLLQKFPHRVYPSGRSWLRRSPWSSECCLVYDDALLWVVGSQFQIRSRLRTE